MQPYESTLETRFKSRFSGENIVFQISYLEIRVKKRLLRSFSLEIGGGSFIFEREGLQKLFRVILHPPIKIA
jgi:hypothetical protein